MTSAQSLHRKFGAVELPLVADGRQNFTSLDPARDILLDLFAAAIGCELEPVWETAVSGSPVLALSQPVSQRLPVLPKADVLQQMKTGFPFLAVARSIEPTKREDYLVYDSKLTQKWSIDYVMGSLALLDEARLSDVLTFVVKTIIMTVDEGGHRAYSEADGRAVQVFGAGGCEFLSWEITESNVGAFPIAPEDPRFLAASLTLETTEVTGYKSSGDGVSVPLMGADYELGIGGAPEGVIEGLLYANTDPKLQRQ